MKLKFAGILFSVAFAFTAQADRVTENQAAAVARSIVARRATMGETLGSSVESVVKSTETNALYFAVKMRGGGTVITSGDTEIEPIVAILPGNADFKDMPAEHPLRELLKRDLALRQRFLDERKRLPVVSVMSVNAAASTKKSRGKWETLLAEDEARNRPRLMSMYGLGGIIDAEGEGAEPIGEPDSYMITDMRVEPLVKATWSQSNNGENEFTPEHSVCGCVATATAQIMHCHQWPTNEFATFKNTCSFNNTPGEYESKPGPYDWANMPANNSWASQLEREAIGKLTYNCGVAVGMMWTPRSSGASSLNIPDAYTKYLGYAQALQVVDFYGNLELHTEDSFRKFLYPSLDAGYPVQFGIADSQGNNGHSVVGDGYGYLDDGEEKIPYVHINMGWGKNSGYNAWYNFPNVPYTATVDGEVTEYVIVTTLTYNILPEFPEPKNSGRDAYILSGRALDEENNPLQDAEIEIINADGLVVSVVSSGVHGVWGAALGCEGPYTVVANLESQNISGEIANLPFRVSENSWGNDIQLTNFSVENKTTGKQYSSLNRAIVNAVDGDVLEVFTQSVFNASCTIDKQLTIRGSAAVAPEIRNVAVAPSVQFNVASNGVLTLSDLTFMRGARNFDTRLLCTEVASNGCLRIEAVNGLEQITLHDSKNFVFAGSVTNPVYIVSAKGVPCEAGDVFGQFDGDEAKACANYLLNDADDELGGLAKDDGTLVWADVPVPEAAAGVRLIEGGVETNYRTLAALLKHRTGDAEVEVVKSGVAIDEEIGVLDKLTIFSYGAPKVINANSKAHFTVNEGGSLLVTNVLIAAVNSNPTMSASLFDINGGEMTLEAGAEIFGLNIPKADIYSGAGAISVDGGRFTLRSGATIRDCSTGGNGGAICAGSGTIVLEGGLIQNCSAKGALGGGGIFAYVPATQILVSGEPVISGNVWNSSQDNLHLYEYPYELASAPLKIAGEMGVNAQIGLSFNQDMTEPYGGAESNVFATVKTPVVSLMLVSSPMTPEERALTAHAFVNDAKPEDLMAAWSEDGEELLWVENTLKGEVAPGFEELATVRTTTEDGKERLYYNLADAFQYLPSAGLVELLTNEVSFVGNITVPYDATIQTMAGTNEIFAIIHDGGVSGSLIVPQGVSLTLTNLDFTCAWQARQCAIEVKGGALTLDANTTVSGYAGFDTRASSAIVVWNGGIFTMNDGAVIHSCRNTFVETKDVNSGAGGAVLIDGVGATGKFLGGIITNCFASAGGGVAVCNEATAHVSGNLLIAANTDRGATDASPSDFVVENLCKLYLAAPFAETARVGRLAGFRADTNLVAYVEKWQDQWTPSELAADAAKFFNDADVSVKGLAVTNDAETALIVWSTAVDENGVYTDAAGNEYCAIEADEPTPQPIIYTPTPVAFKEITRVSETEWQLVVTDLVEKCEYALTFTDDLTTGFVTTGEWFKATFNGAWTTNVIFEVEKPACFWKALGRETEEVPVN